MLVQFQKKNLEESKVVPYVITGTYPEICLGRKGGRTFRFHSHYTLLQMFKCAFATPYSNYSSVFFLTSYSRLFHVVHLKNSDNNQIYYCKSSSGYFSGLGLGLRRREDFGFLIKKKRDFWTTFFWTWF